MFFEGAPFFRKKRYLCSKTNERLPRCCISTSFFGRSHRPDRKCQIWLCVKAAQKPGPSVILIKLGKGPFWKLICLPVNVRLLYAHCCGLRWISWLPAKDQGTLVLFQVVLLFSHFAASSVNSNKFGQDSRLEDYEHGKFRFKYFHLRGPRLQVFCCKSCRRRLSLFRYWNAETPFSSIADLAVVVPFRYFVLGSRFFCEAALCSEDWQRC